MDLKKRFLHINQFLIQHQYLHELEIMERFPYPLKEPYQSWAMELMKLSDEELIEIECFSKTDSIQSESLKEFILKTKELEEIPQAIIGESEIAKQLQRKLTPKKTHEIKIIKNYLEKLSDIDTLIDIGSGAGHLSSALVINNHLFSYCIDMNKEFQSGGINKLKHWAPEVLNKLEFINILVSKENEFKFKFDSQKTMILGLHACGALSTHIIQSFEKHQCKELLNFGCCYHKLIDEYNISKIGKELNLSFTNHALTMAAKCYSVFGIEEYLNRYFVKRFRYTLHFYMSEVLKKPFLTLGNAKAIDYKASFSDYVFKYYQNGADLDPTQLDNYFNSNRNQANLKLALVAGIIRSKLGRLIEIYINIDRAMYLVEKGYHVNLVQMFQRQISPRNLGLIAKKI